MISTSLSVGVIGAIVKAMVITGVATVGEAASQTIKLMCAFRLCKKGSAPLVFHSDGRPFTFRDTYRRLGSRTYGGVFLIAVLCVLVFPAEMATDFGVDVSTKCRPLRLETTGICASKIPVFMSWDKAFLTAFQVEDAPWEDEALVANPVREGFRKTFDGSEYFGDWVKRNESLQIVIANCSVTEEKMLPAGDTLLHFTSKPVSSADGIRMPKITSRNATFSGMGMITNNNVFHSSFLTVLHKSKPGTTPIVTLLEYPYSDHIAHIEQRMIAPNASVSITVEAKYPVFTYTLNCGTAVIIPKEFQDGIYGYRFAQLSKPGTRKPFEVRPFTVDAKTFHIPRPVRASDVVRATISSKVSEAISCPGETFVYTSCGYFIGVYAYPLIGIGAVIFLTAILFLVRARVNKPNTKFPVSSKAWAWFALNNSPAANKYCERDSDEFKNKYRKFGRADGVGEYVLTEDGFQIRQVIFSPAPVQGRASEP